MGEGLSWMETGQHSCHSFHLAASLQGLKGHFSSTQLRFLGLWCALLHHFLHSPHILILALLLLCKTALISEAEGLILRLLCGHLRVVIMSYIFSCSVGGKNENVFFSVRARNAHKKLLLQLNTTSDYWFCSAVLIFMQNLGLKLHISFSITTLYCNVDDDLLKTVISMVRVRDLTVQCLSLTYKS